MSGTNFLEKINRRIDYSNVNAQAWFLKAESLTQVANDTPPCLTSRSPRLVILQRRYCRHDPGVGDGERARTVDGRYQTDTVVTDALAPWCHVLAVDLVNRRRLVLSA